MMCRDMRLAILWAMFIMVLSVPPVHGLPLQLTMPEENAQSPDSVVLPVHLITQSAQASAIVARIAYDPVHLNFISGATGLAALSAGKQADFNAADGIVHVAVYGGSSALRDGELFALSFSVAPGISSGTVIPLNDAGSSAASPEASPIDTVFLPGSVSITGGGEGEGEGEGEGAPRYHDADTGRDWRISISELLRVIQFYNSPEYRCASGTEDGFAPGPGNRECRAHDGDYNPKDWRISLTELLRVIQFYNSPGHAYHRAPGAEDGFAPGAG